MRSQRFVSGVAVLGAVLMACSNLSCAQNYPTKPIRIVAAEAGSPNDSVARLLAAGMSAGLGQQVLVDNRGGGGIIQPETVSKAPPDGYTLMFIGSQLWLLPFMSSHVPYQMTDFRAISLATTSPGFLVVHPSLPVKSVQELIALAKRRPGALNYASGSAGALTQLAPELFKYMTGINMVSIPYRGGASALNAVMSGEVQIMFSTPAGVVPQIRAGRVRGIAVTSAQRSALLPELPTVAASGVPGFEAAAMIGMLAHAKVPTAIITRLNEEIVRTLAKPEVKEKLLGYGLEVVGNSADEFTAKIASEMDRMGKVINSVGIRAD